MAPASLQLPAGSGLLDSLAQVAGLAGTVVLLLVLVALGAYAYKQLRGGGVRWPDEDRSPDGDDGVTKNSSDDEWKYS